MRASRSRHFVSSSFFVITLPLPLTHPTPGLVAYRGVVPIGARGATAPHTVGTRGHRRIVPVPQDLRATSAPFAFCRRVSFIHLSAARRDLMNPKYHKSYLVQAFSLPPFTFSETPCF